jgi:hypothetical protein
VIGVAWVPIPGHPGYLVSNDGRVFGKRGRLLKPTPHSKGFGHQRIKLVREDGRRIEMYVHTLVAQVFIGPRPNGMEVRHLDGNAADNRPANLAWGTRSENQSDAVRHGTHANAKKNHCKYGHEFTPENTRYTQRRNGWKRRACRTCDRDQQRAKYARARAGAE